MDTFEASPTQLIVSGNGMTAISAQLQGCPLLTYPIEDSHASLVRPLSAVVAGRGVEYRDDRGQTRDLA